MGGDFTPRHARRYAEIGEAIRDAVAAYATDVRAGAFPGHEHSVHMDESVLDEVRRGGTSAGPAKEQTS